jgi:hypothetical protein
LLSSGTIASSPREFAVLSTPINNRFNSTSAANSTHGAPMVIAEQIAGSNIQPAIEITVPAGPSTLRNWPLARCSTRRTETLKPKYGCHL